MIAVVSREINKDKIVLYYGIFILFLITADSTTTTLTMVIREEPASGNKDFTVLDSVEGQRFALAAVGDFRRTSVETPHFGNDGPLIRNRPGACALLRKKTEQRFRTHT